MTPHDEAHPSGTAAERIEALKAALRNASTEDMLPAELAALCNCTLPGCTVPEIVKAMRELADEQFHEADALERLHGRC